jgi:hypothetical protein
MMTAECFEDLSSNQEDKYPTSDLLHMSAITHLLNEALKKNRINTFKINCRNYTVKINKFYASPNHHYFD